WPSQVQLLTVLTLRRRPVRKVPLQFGRSGHELGNTDGGLADRGPLIAHEEENLVLLDGSPKGASEFVALQSVPGAGEDIPRIQAIVTDHLEAIDMERVTSGFGDGICRCRSLSNIGGILCAGGNLKLLQRVRKGQEHAGTAELINVICAVPVVLNA